MKKKVKQILSAVLVSTMLSGMLPISALAASTDGDYDWQGEWIWTNDALPSADIEGQWVDLRKTFTLDEIPEVAEARISVDSRYWMWINGSMAVYEGQLKSGPDKHSWYYDVVDLTPYLVEGENTIAVLAVYWGFTSASAVPTGKQAFLFDAVFSDGALSDGSTRLISDASWKVQKDTGFEKPPVRGNKRPDGVDTKYNAATATEGWQEVGFDDSAWANATVKTLSQSDPRNTLVERSIPQWKVYDVVTYDESEWTVDTDATFSALSLPESYTVTAEVKSLKGSIGLAVCVNDASNFYMPQIQKASNTTLTIKPHVYKDASWSFPDTSTASGSISEKMTVTVEVSGSNVVTYINGTQVSSFSDTALEREGSSIGFRSSSANEMTAVYSLKVTDSSGDTLWEDSISESQAGDEVTEFKNLKTNGDAPYLAEDADGTYMHVQNGVIVAGEMTPGETTVYSVYNSTNMQGVPYIKVKSATGGETIKLSSDSTAHSGGESVLHYYVTKAGEQEYEPYGWMSAWRVDFTIPSSVEVLELGFRQSSYNTEHTGTMDTDNDELNQLYQEAYDTLLITMRDIYMDCPDRERTQWWGDAVLEMQQAAYAMDDNAKLLYKKLLTQVVGWSEGRGGSLPTVPTDDLVGFYDLHAQCVAGVHSLWQYYLYYGETDILEYCYEPFLDYLKLWDISDTGYLTHRAGTSDWIDWGNNVDASVSDHTWYYLAAKNMRNVAKVLGKDQADIDYLENRIELIEDNFVSMFWNEELGAYYSNTSNGKPDDRAQAMAVYSGLADPAHYPELLEVIKTTENSSPYMEKYVLEALYIMGYAEEAIERTLKRYEVMLTDEHPTLYEGFDTSGLSGNNGTATRNHAWSGGPLSLMYMYNAGILSTGAGFSTFTVRPHLGSLTYITASTDTVSGKIAVNATKNSLSVTVPTGSTSALICVPRIDGKATTITLGGVVVYDNGAVVTAGLPAGVSYAGEDADYVNFTVASGNYDFAMSEDTADTAATHSFTVTATGNGTVTVNGQTVPTPYTYTGTGNVTVVATSAQGSRVAYIAGIYPEDVYADSVERTYTLDRDMTLNIVFDELLDKKPLLKIVDASNDPSTPSNIKEMFYAYRLYVNGEEVAMNQYFRDYMLPLPYMRTASKGETVTVSVKPVNSKNYEVYLDDGSGKLTDEITLTVNGDATLKITVVEKDTVNTYKIASITSNSILARSGQWNYTNGIDGSRITDWHHNVNSSTHKFLSSGYASRGYSSDTPSSPITITLDLGSAQKVNQVSLFPKNSYGAFEGGAPCFPKDFTISVSSDGTSYQTVASFTDYENPGVHQQTFDFDEVEARYVKITVTKLGTPDYSLSKATRYRVQLAEIEVAHVTYVSDDTTPPSDDQTDTTVQKPTADDDTAETDDTPQTEEADNQSENGGDGEKKKGCSSTLAGGMATVLLGAATACLFRKKKKD